MLEKHQYTTEELTDIWAEFEKEWHMGPGYHLCADDVPKFLAYIDKWYQTKHKCCDNCANAPSIIPIDGPLPVCVYWPNCIRNGKDHWKCKKEAE